MRLKGLSFIITGAGGGMGAETVKRFREEGANVAAIDLRAAVEEQDDSFLSIAADLTNEAVVIKLFQQVNEKFGKIDGLVNLLGIAQAAIPIDEVTLSDWNKIMNVNITSIFLTCRQAAVHMKKQREGVIANIASISMVRPRPGLNAYIASKGAVVSLSQALAIELAEYNIRVNVVNPGPADTKMLGQFAATGSVQADVKEAVFRKSVPLGKLIQPIDIANALVYLCSNEAAMVTGEVLNVDGGRGL